MTTLQDIENLAQELIATTFDIKARLKTHHVNLKNEGYTFHFDNAKKRAGRCHYGKKIISLSRYLMMANIDKPESIEDTIRHEIAHAISIIIYGKNEGRGHGYAWKNVCIQIGAKPQARYTLKKYPTQVKGKYTLTCPSCGQTSEKHKKPRYSYSCGKCSGGKYNPEFKLEIKQKLTKIKHYEQNIGYIRYEIR